MTPWLRGGWHKQIFQQDNPIILKVLNHGAIERAAYLVNEAKVINSAIKLARFLLVSSESMAAHLSALVIGHCQWEHQDHVGKGSRENFREGWVAVVSITSRLMTASRWEAELNQGLILDTVTTANGQERNFFQRKAPRGGGAGLNLYGSASLISFRQA